MQVSVLNVGVGNLEEQIKSFKNPLVLGFQKFFVVEDKRPESSSHGWSDGRVLF